MWEISIWFFAFLFAINGFLVYIDTALAESGSSYDLISPFTNQTFTPPALPNMNNTLGNLTANTATNSTGGTSVGIWDITNFAWNGSVFFINFLVGSITGSFLTSLGLPTAFLTLLYGTETIFVAITILHFWRGIF